ncbi:MAG TPA: site-specific integrase [Pirellulales bacterium]|nr:site-specific integrase [Pirellulales bacterium]
MEEIKVTVVQFGDRKNLQLQYIDPITQKKKTRSAGTSNRREAEKAAGKWEDELRTGRYKPAVKMTWDDFWTRYDDEVLSGLAEKTAKKAFCVRSVVEDILSPQRISDLNADRLSYFQAELRRRGNTEDTISGYLGHLRSALKWATRMTMLREVPAIAMPKRTAGSKGRPITGEEFERMLAKTVDVVGTEAAASFEHYLRGLWWSGLRLGESLELWWDRDDRLLVDLSGKRPMLHIPAELEKGNQSRLLPVAPEFAELLLATPEADRTGRVFKLARRCHSGERLTDDRVIRLVGAIGKKAGVKVWTHPVSGKVKFASAHDLRRSFGFRWSSRVMPALLKELMRHENIDTTMQYYVGRNAQSTADALWAAYERSGNTSGNSQAKDPSFSG